MEDIAGSILKVQGATLALHDETSIPFFFFFLSPRKLLGRFFYSTTGFVAAASASLTAILLERKSRYASCCRDNRVWSRNIGVLYFIKWKSIYSHFCISLIVADFGWNVGVSYIIHVQQLLYWVTCNLLRSLVDTVSL